MPVRKTKYSAGYDVEAAEDCIVPAFKAGQAPTLIKTGIKAYMPGDEYLMLCNRSSNPKKKGLFYQMVLELWMEIIMEILIMMDI